MRQGLQQRESVETASKDQASHILRRLTHTPHHLNGCIGCGRTSGRSRNKKMVVLVFRNKSPVRLAVLMWMRFCLCLAVHPPARGEYLQQIEIYGGLVFLKVFPALPHDRWTFICFTLEKVSLTKDGRSRTMSQWKLTVKLNGKVFFDSDVEKVYSQCIRSIGLVFVGNETTSGNVHMFNPSNTGDGIGVVYHDAVKA